MKEGLANLNDQISYLRDEKAKTEKEPEVVKKEKFSLAVKFAKLSLHTKELEGKAERVVVLECDIDALQRENAKLRVKLKERDDQILDLQAQIPAQCEFVIAKFKESDELKAMLKAAQEGGITEKFGEWSRLGYLDKAKMTADLIATEKEAKLIAEPSVAEKNVDGKDVMAETSEDEEEDGRET